MDVETTLAIERLTERIDALEISVHGDMTDLRGEVGDLHGKVGGLRGEVGGPTRRGSRTARRDWESARRNARGARRGTKTRQDRFSQQIAKFLRTADVSNMQILHTSSERLPLLFVFRGGPPCATSKIHDSPFIDFISAYCDHWCERCALTGRCYAFAWQAEHERTRADRGDPLKALRLLLSKDRTESTVPAADLAEFSRRERARDARVDASKIMRLALEYRDCSTAWVDDRRGGVAAQADAAVVEAFETIWDTLTPDLVRAGFHVLTFDQRGFGDTAGGPADQNKALGDAETSYVYLRSKPDVEKGRMAVGGASCGVTYSAALARIHPDITALLLLSGGASDASKAYVKATPSLAVFGAAADREAEDIRALVTVSRHPQSTLRVVRGRAHGVPMFDEDADLKPSIVKWLTARFPHGGPGMSFP